LACSQPFFLHNRTQSIQFNRRVENGKQQWFGNFSSHCGSEVLAEIFVHIADGFINFNSELNFETISLPEFDPDQTRFWPQCPSVTHFAGAASRILSIYDFGFTEITDVSIAAPAFVNQWKRILSEIRVEISIPPSHIERSNLEISTKIGKYHVPVTFIEGLHVLDDCNSELAIKLDSEQRISIVPGNDVVDIFFGPNSCKASNGDFGAVSLSDCGNSFSVTKNSELAQNMHLLIVTQNTKVFTLTLQESIEPHVAEDEENVHTVEPVNDSDAWSTSITLREIVFVALILFNFGYTYFSNQSSKPQNEAKAEKEKG